MALVGLLTVAMLILGVSCTGGGNEGDESNTMFESAFDNDNGTVADNNVGSVTSQSTEKMTEKATDRVTERVTERATERVTEKATDKATEQSTTGTTETQRLPSTTPSETSAETSAVTGPAITGKARGGKGGK